MDDWLSDSEIANNKGANVISAAKVLGSFSFFSCMHKSMYVGIAYRDRATAPRLKSSGSDMTDMLSPRTILCNIP